MTRDDIIRWACDAGCPDSMVFLAAYERLAVMVAAAEREACAKVCDDYYRVVCKFESRRLTHTYIMGKGARQCAHIIRSRSRKPSFEPI